MALAEIVKTLDETTKEIKKLTLEELKKLFWIDIREDNFDDDAVRTTRLRAVCRACHLEIFAKNLSELIGEMIEHIINEIIAIRWGLVHLNYLTSEKLKKEVEEIDSDGSR